MKQPPVAIVQDIECGTGTRIDLEQGEGIADNEKIDAVDPDQAERSGQPGNGLRELARQRLGDAGRAGDAAETEGAFAGSVGPLLGRRQHLCRSPIAEERQRDRAAGSESF